VALHAGNLPGYPASHGCVRLLPKFAENLYALTQVGTPVIIAGDTSDPASVKDPGPILGSSAKETIPANVGKKAVSPASSSAVTSILVSRADKRIYVLQNGTIVAEGDANIKDPGEGTNVFVWQGGDPNGSSWKGMGFHADAGGATAPNTAVLERIEGSPDVMDAIRKRMKPGTVLVTTATELTCYYYAYLLAGAFLMEKRKEIGLWLIVLGIGTHAVERLHIWDDDKYVLMSLLSLAWCGGTLYALLKPELAGATAAVPEAAPVPALVGQVPAPPAPPRRKKKR
jgi:hypothetical protein